MGSSESSPRHPLPPPGCSRSAYGTQMGAYGPVRLRRKSAIGNHYCDDFAYGTALRTVSERARRVNGEYIAKARTLDHEHSRQADGTRYTAFSWEKTDRAEALRADAGL